MSSEPRSAPVIPPGAALLVAVAAISWAGPLVRLAEAPSLAVATWRLIFSVGFVALILLARGSLLKGTRLGRKDWVLALLSGLFLAGHFWVWFASVRFTTIASAVVLVSTHPFWIAGLSVLFLGERPARREWAGIGIAVAGAAVIGWGDMSLGAEALLGDLLAILAALLVAGYYTIGRRLRQKLDLWSYVGLVYGAAALALLAAAAVSPGVPLTGYPLGDWLVFLALAAGPMMLGHTGVNYAIRYMPAYVANLVILGEAVGATLIAWLLPGIREVPPGRTLLGAAMILAGIAVGTLRRRAPTEVETGAGPSSSGRGGGGSGARGRPGATVSRHQEAPCGRSRRSSFQLWSRPGSRYPSRRRTAIRRAVSTGG